MSGAMTPEEIRYHARRVAAMRNRKFERGDKGRNDFRQGRVRGSGNNYKEHAIAAVDEVFQVRRRRGWLPRGGDE